MQYMKFLYGFCGLWTYHEYSLHHKFSDGVTIHDIRNVENIIASFKQPRNPFKNDGNSNAIKNAATGTVIYPNTTNHLLACTESGKLLTKTLLMNVF